MTTRTLAVADVSSGAYAEVRDLLVSAGYDHAICEDDGREVLDLHGIALRCSQELTCPTCGHCFYGGTHDPIKGCDVVVDAAQRTGGPVVTRTRASRGSIRVAAEIIFRRTSGLGPVVMKLAESQTPRPGRWYGDGCSVVVELDGKLTFVVDDLFKQFGDGRKLDQTVTDALIVIEAHRLLSGAVDPTELERRAPWPVATMRAVPTEMAMATAQRGGIHTDAFVRAVALALWGYRDVGVPRATVPG